MIDDIVSLHARHRLKWEENELTLLAVPKKTGRKARDSGVPNPGSIIFLCRLCTSPTKIKIGYVHVE